MHIYVTVDKELYTNFVIYHGDNVNLVLPGTRPQNNTKVRQRRAKGKYPLQAPLTKFWFFRSIQAHLAPNSNITTCCSY